MRALENKATHRDCIARDSLLVELALKTGMRRAAGQASRPSNISSESANGIYKIVGSAISSGDARNWLKNVSKR